MAALRPRHAAASAAALEVALDGNTAEVFGVFGKSCRHIAWIRIPDRRGLADVWLGHDVGVGSKSARVGWESHDRRGHSSSSCSASLPMRRSICDLLTSSRLAARKLLSRLGEGGAEVHALADAWGACAEELIELAAGAEPRCRDAPQNPLSSTPGARRPLVALHSRHASRRGGPRAAGTAAVKEVLCYSEESKSHPCS